MIWPFDKIHDFFDDLNYYKDETLNNGIAIDFVQEDIRELNKCNFQNATALVALANKLGLIYDWDKKDWVKVSKSKSR